MTKDELLELRKNWEQAKGNYEVYQASIQEQLNHMEMLRRRAVLAREKYEDAENRRRNQERARKAKGTLKTLSDALLFTELIEQGSDTSLKDYLWYTSTGKQVILNYSLAIKITLTMPPELLEDRPGNFYSGARLAWSGRVRSWVEGKLGEKVSSISFILDEIVIRTDHFKTAKKALDLGGELGDELYVTYVDSKRNVDIDIDRLLGKLRIDEK